MAFNKQEIMEAIIMKLHRDNQEEYWKEVRAKIKEAIVKDDDMELDVQIMSFAQNMIQAYLDFIHEMDDNKELKKIVDEQIEYLVNITIEEMAEAVIKQKKEKHESN